MLIDDMIEAIKNADKILITSHVDPDGDAISSSLAMYNTLLNHYSGKEVYVCLDDASENFDYLKGFEDIVSLDKLKEKTKLNFDLMIVLDLPDPDRLGKRKDLLEKADEVMVIDHHERNRMFGDYNLVDPTEPSTTQIVYSFLTGVELDISKDVMECILTGIITDTGGFRFPAVNEDTFYIASVAKKMNIDITKIFNRAIFNKTKTQFEIERLAISRIKLYLDDKVAITYLINDDDIYVRRKPGDTEAIVNISKNIEGVEISAFLRQVEGGYKISLRSNNVAVDDIAEHFDGGGHKYAAGCTVNTDTVEEAIDMLLKEIEKKKI